MTDLGLKFRRLSICFGCKQGDKIRVDKGGYVYGRQMPRMFLTIIQMKKVMI